MHVIQGWTGMDVELHTFLTLVVNEGWWSPSRTNR